MAAASASTDPSERKVTFPMTITPKIELEDRDLSRVLDMCGHFSRAASPDEYQKLVPHMQEAVLEIARIAFIEGREYERKTGGK